MAWQINFLNEGNKKYIVPLLLGAVELVRNLIDFYKITLIKKN